jgi:hypothetical protein
MELVKPSAVTIHGSYEINKVGEKHVLTAYAIAMTPTGPQVCGTVRLEVADPQVAGVLVAQLSEAIIKSGLDKKLIALGRNGA